MFIEELALLLVSLLAGVWRGRRVGAWCAARPRAGACLAIGLSLAWLALSHWARRYADGDGPGWAWAEWFAHRGKWQVFGCAVAFLLGAAFAGCGLGRVRVAIGAFAGIAAIGLVVWRTMPSYVWLGGGDKRGPDGYLRQSIEYTCGPVCLGNLIEQSLGRPSPGERELARLAGTTAEGTPLRSLIAAAEKTGLALASCRIMNLSELRRLESLAVVQISSLPTVRHATLLLRVEGDAVEFIDPAYGRRTLPVKRFEAIWYGKTTVFRPADLGPRSAAERHRSGKRP